MPTNPVDHIDKPRYSGKIIRMPKDHALILAAGRGLRLKSVAPDTPKCLVLVGGKPILEHQIVALEKQGITNITIVVGYLSQMVEDFVRFRFPHLSVDFVYNAQFHENNIISSHKGGTKMEATRYVLQLDADVIFDADLIGKLITQEPGRDYVAAAYRQCGKEEMKILLHSDGTIRSINKSINPSDAIGEALGINVFTAATWKKFQDYTKTQSEEYPHEFYEYTMERMIADGHRFYPLNIHPYRAIDVDFPDDLESARSLFKEW